MQVSTIGKAVALAGALVLGGCGGNSSSLIPSTGGTSANSWAWVGGSQSANQLGTYGTLGQAAKANMPGAREYPQTWRGGNGELWLFGGFGMDALGGQGALNDFWKYDPASGEWTWVDGSKTVPANGSYGTQGTASASNEPPGREDAATWVDASGNLWLMGGYLDGVSGLANDLWEYNVSTGQWVWMSGAKTTDQAGSYGTEGVAASTNVPGARRGAVTWIGANGDLWLFGGNGYDSTGNHAYLNDLWKYDPSSNQWTWVGGSKFTGALAVYGQKGTPAANNDPGARKGAVSWNGPNGDFWLFGGTDSSNNQRNDLWKYDLASGQWVWVSGSNQSNQNGTYGTQGVEGSVNVPGARYWASSWADKNGNLWLFGGLGYGASGSSLGSLDDLWKYSTATNKWTWVRGSDTTNASAVYGTLDKPNSANTPGGREAGGAWADADGTSLWFFGGQDYNLNDYNALWKFQP